MSKYMFHILNTSIKLFQFDCSIFIVLVLYIKMDKHDSEPYLYLRWRTSTTGQYS